MATLLDLGLLNYFSVIFPFLLIFVLTYAVLSKTKFLGENNGIYGLIAFCLAMMTIFVPNVVTMINIMTPWLVLLFVFLILSVVALMALGMNFDTVAKYMNADWSVVHWVIFAFVLLIFLGSLASSFSDSLTPYDSDSTGESYSGSKMSAEDLTTGQSTDTGDFSGNIAAVIFHPKILGALFLLLVCVFTVAIMASGNK